jgi:uncharacterized protein YceK
MPLASTSRTRVEYLLESVFGTIPGAGTPKSLRVTGESLDFAVQTETSKEIRSDRQTTDLVLVGASASGGVNMELSYNEFDPLMEATLMDTWQVYGTAGVGATFSATFTTTTITAAVAPSGNSAFTGLARGQWFRLTAPTHANDGKFFRVSSSVSPTTTVITVDAATPLAAGTGIAGTLVSTSRLTNGVNQRSFTIQRSFNDVNQFFAFRGMTASKMSLSFQSGAILTGMFDFMGKDAIRSNSTQMPAAPAASQAYDVMNSVVGVGQVMEGGALLTGTFIKSLTLDVDNKLRGRTAIGTLGNVDIGSGTLEIKGSMEVYLENGTLYDKFLASASSSLSLRATDPAGNGYIISMPKVKYNDAKVNAGGIDQDAMLSLPFTALMDPTTQKTIFIDRVGVAAV